MFATILKCYMAKTLLRGSVIGDHKTVGSAKMRKGHGVVKELIKRLRRPLQPLTTRGFVFKPQQDARGRLSPPIIY